MTAHRAQNRQRFLLHFEELLQFLHGLIVPSGAELICHLEHHRVQYRFRHRVNVGFFDLLRTGVGADFIDFTAQRRHRTAGNIDQVGAQIG